MIKLKRLIGEIKNQRYTLALQFPNGEIAIANENEKIHGQIYDRLLKQNHPNLLRRDDPDVEAGWVDENGKFLTREEMSKILGYNADSFGKVF
jgi:hypothetical protein